MRGAASRGGSASGSAADRQGSYGSRGGTSSGRPSNGAERPWQSRTSSAGDSSGRARRPSGDGGGTFRRPSDRQDRGSSAGYGRGDDRSGRRPDDAATAPRTHNARDLRSANRPDRERSPEIDEDVKGDELDRVTRAQIRNLEERSALWVSKHLVMAGRLLDLDPELAFQHALAASRRGGRLAAVREAVGLTAYAAGHYGEALREFRTFRRISGSNVHLPVMADCERGLGRPDRALDLARSEEAESLDAAGKAELAMVVSGARSDLDQLDAAVAALEIPQLDLHRAFAFSPRLFRAYADALDAVGRTAESEKWRRQARVAEKALGLDDDLEPDIIDLGEDDEPTPDRVPRVAEVLAGPARNAHGSTDDEAGQVPTQQSEGFTEEGAGTSARNEPTAVQQDDDEDRDQDDVTDGLLEHPDEELGTDPTEMPDRAAGRATQDPAATTAAMDQGLVGDVSLDLEADLAEPGTGRTTETTAIEEPVLENSSPGTAEIQESAESQESGDLRNLPAEVAGGPEETDEADEAQGADDVVPAADAVSAGESAPRVEPLQTEMLFSMDAMGGTRIEPSTDDVDIASSAGDPAVQFSAGEAPDGSPSGSSSGAAAPQDAEDPATAGAVQDEPGQDGPAQDAQDVPPAAEIPAKSAKARRTPKTKATTEDAADE
ncbi:hypothetical protein [Arthrobacter bussei]|uniref:hypothetical protein n=1 Tax=Arthrobacter bussei TaxID=2594179 RepID=UPI001F50E3AF|nr:hypothetical protein [Arthrobacter bussei]